MTHAGGCSGSLCPFVSFPIEEVPRGLLCASPEPGHPPALPSTGRLPLVLRGHEQMTYSSLSRVPSKLYVVGPGFSERDKCRVRPAVRRCSLPAHSAVQALCHYCNTSLHTLLIFCRKKGGGQRRGKVKLLKPVTSSTDSRQET